MNNIKLYTKILGRLNAANKTIPVKTVLFVVLSLLFGALIFISIYGVDLLNPTYDKWIYTHKYDLVENYIGWKYYREAPLTFPLGVFDSLTYPIKSSILNPSSIPLLAVFFKLLSPILPETFQYFGLWGLSCYMMQYLMGMFIAKRFVKNDIQGLIISLLVGAMFTFMPLISKLMYQHTAMSCQWVILLAFIPILYHNKIDYKYEILIYSVIGLLIGGIQPYFVAIIGIIITFYTVYLCIKNKSKKYFNLIIFYVLSSILSTYVTGGFSMNTYFSADNLLTDSFNLLGFFNSYGKCRFFNLHEDILQQGIASSYLGLGIILSIVIVSFSVLYKYLSSKKDNFFSSFLVYKTELITISIMMFVALFLSLSPQVTLGTKTLYIIPLPDVLYKAWSVFRCTGRFIWINEYIFIIFLIVYIIKNFSKRHCIIIFIFCLICQLYDIFPILNYKNEQMDKNLIENYNFYDYQIPKSLFKDNNIKYVYFDNIINENNHIVKFTELFLELADMGYDHNVKYNGFYLSRFVKGTKEKFGNELNNPKDDDLFIFSLFELAEDAIEKSPLDYFYIHDEWVFGRTKPIEGFEEKQIKKTALLNFEFH